MTTMRSPRRKSALVEVGGLVLPDWETFGFDAAQASDWARSGFDAFEAALALGDGFNLMSAIHERSLLLRVAADWGETELRSVEGLHWHQGGFSLGEALRWRARNCSVSLAMAIRAGYVKDE